MLILAIEDQEVRLGPSQVVTQRQPHLAAADDDDVVDLHVCILRPAAAGVWLPKGSRTHLMINIGRLETYGR
jgi:hypothetical protein